MSTSTATLRLALVARPTVLTDAALVVAGTLLVAACAQVSIDLPFTPVPITLQTFAVLLVGSSLGTLRGWVSVIARNLAIHHLKARHRLRGLEQTTEMDHVAEHTRAEVPVTERTKLVIDAHECLRRLPRLQREVLKADLELGDSASARELAQRLRTTPGSIYVSRLKGRRSLLRELRKLGHDLVQLEFLGTNRLNPAHG